MTRALVQGAAWLSDDVLLVALSGLPGAEGAVSGQLAWPGGHDELEVRLLAYEEGESLLTARLERSTAPGDGLGSLILRFEGEPLETDLAELGEAVQELKSLGRMRFGALGSRARSSVLDFLASTPVEHSATANPLRLHRGLVVLREVIRNRLPLSVLAAEEPEGVGLEAVLRVDERSFYLQGWVHDDGRAERLTAVSPEGARAELLGLTFRYPRADIDRLYGEGEESSLRHGFSAFLELDGPSLHPSGWVLELWTSSQTGIEARGPDVIQDPDEVQSTILADLDHERPSEETLLLDHVHPALEGLQARTSVVAEVERVVELGVRNEAPTASIVIPLYRRIDFLEHQLAHFALDPELREADLLFVLDSPALADRTESLARSLHELYRVPLRLAILKRHAGYAAVNNVGASLADGRLLVLLNSDVFPDRPGWLGTMAAAYDATPGIGALGAKLVYEDRSLQHAGMRFQRQPGSALWGNAHYFKGFHGSFAAANVMRTVPAVTGACLMIDRGVYQRLGGLRGTYIGGDNEDSDLCLRLLQEGLQNWYLPEAELYHLEGQSVPKGLRALTRRYNDWLQTREWGDLIASLPAAAVEEAVPVAVSVPDE